MDLMEVMKYLYSTCPSLQITLSTKRVSVAGPAALRSKVLSANMDRIIQAYHNMNKFLAAYLEHVRISS